MKLPWSRRFYKSRIFYGWYIVFGLATVGMVSAGMGGINLGLFLPAMSNELGISHTYFGWSYSARLIGFSVTSWLIGILLDRYGARCLMAVAGILTGLIMESLSKLQADWQLVALYFALGMIGLEGSGGNLYQAVPLSRWFIFKRGQAMAFGVLGTASGIFIFCPLTEFLIASKGWRSAWMILGCGGSIIIVLVAVLIIRKDPQSMGLQPDGFSSTGIIKTKSSRSKTKIREEFSWLRADAIRTSAFWSLVLIHGLRMLSISTMHVFRIPFYIEKGVQANLVAWAISMEAVISALFSILAGRAVDRFQPPLVVAISLIFFSLMFVVTINVCKTWHVYIAAALYGISAVTYVVAQNALWPYFFGSAHIGSIRGLSLVITMIFSIIGAPVCGFIKDTTGSYMPAWIASLFLLAGATILMLVTKKPRPRPDDKTKILRKKKGK